MALLIVLDLILLTLQGAIVAWAFASIHRPGTRPGLMAMLAAGWTGLYAWHLDWGSEPWVRGTTAVLFALLIVWLLGGATLLRSLFSVCTVSAAVVLCEFVVTFSIHSVQPGNALGDPLAMLFKLLTALLMAAVLPLIVVLWHVYVDKLPPKSLHMFVLVPVSQLFAITIIIINISINSSNLTSTILGILSILFFLAVDIGLFRSVRQTRRNEELLHMNRHMKDQLQLQFAHYKQLAAAADKLQKLRHDMINHLETIRLLLADQPDATAGSMLTHFSSDLANARMFHYCRNPIVDAVLSNKTEDAQTKNVALELNVEWPASASYDDLDLCSLFANLLDNAIEAASHSALLTAERKVRLDCYTQSGFLIIRCRNGKAHGIRRNEKGRLLTTKRDPASNHGIGLTILNDIAAKYGGELKTEDGERHFQTTVYLLEESA